MITLNHNTTKIRSLDKLPNGHLPDWEELPSITGASTYEIAVKNGYKGTEQEWLDEITITAEKVEPGTHSWLDNPANADKVFKPEDYQPSFDKWVETHPETINKAAAAVAVQSEAPAPNDNARVWINPDANREWTIPEVKDDLINPVDTWSSQKIVQYIETYVQEQLAALQK